MLNPPEGDSGGFCFNCLWSDFCLGCLVIRRNFLSGEGEMPVWLLQRSSYLTDRSGMQLASCSYSGCGLKQPPAQQCVGWATRCLSCPALHCQDLSRPLELQAGLKERAPGVGVIEAAATEKVWHILGDQTGWPKCVERVGGCCSEDQGDPWWLGEGWAYTHLPKAWDCKVIPLSLVWEESHGTSALGCLLPSRWESDWE